jgi:hypothetical protein
VTIIVRLGRSKAAPLADHGIGLVQLAGVLGRLAHLRLAGTAARQLVRMMPAEQPPIGLLDLVGLGVRSTASKRNAAA